MRRAKWIVGGLVVIVAAGLIAFVAWRQSLTNLGVKLGVRTEGNVDAEVAFIKFPNETQHRGDAYLYDVDTGVITQLTVNNRFSNLNWSLDGASLILIDDNGNTSVLEGVTGDLKRTNVIQPTNPLLFSETRASILSPDGKRNLLPAGSCCEYGKPIITSHVTVANVDGTNTRDLGPGQSPSWSPDGKQIAFSAQLTNDADPEIYVINNDGSNLHRLVANPGWDNYPVWSPDGKYLFFLKETYTDDRVLKGETLYTVTADGQNLTKIDDIEYVMNFPAWSASLPDSQWLVYVDSQQGNFWRVTSDGSQKSQMFVNADYPSLSPRGTSVAYIDKFAQHRLCFSGFVGSKFLDRVCNPNTDNATHPEWRPYRH